ncbi:MAG TPA: YraN family protein [Acidimicrobiia bacterium]|nr:YraN family protein [Acidimicrobiia bacterium]
MPDPRRALGAAGEDLAAAWYEAEGYRVLARNWRCRQGELDLVVARPDVLVFCEVKTRRGDAYGGPAAAVTHAKQQRIRGLALRWLGEHSVRAPSLRFDVVAVRKERGRAPVIEVLEGVF